MTENQLSQSPQDEQTAAETIQSPPPKPLNRVNKTAAVRLKTEQGLTYRQIAKLQGVTPAAIYQGIKNLIPDEETETFKTNRSDIFARLQKDILKTVNNECITEAGLGERSNAALKLHAAERLERGLSSANIGVAVGLAPELQAALDKLVLRIA